MKHKANFLILNLMNKNLNANIGNIRIKLKKLKNNPLLINRKKFKIKNSKHKKF